MLHVKAEIRVRPVTRYVVTRYESGHDDEENVGWVRGCKAIGEFNNAQNANVVAAALGGAEEPGTEGVLRLTDDPPEEDRKRVGRGEGGEEGGGLGGCDG